MLLLSLLQLLLKITSATTAITDTTTTTSTNTTISILLVQYRLSYFHNLISTKLENISSLLYGCVDLIE